MEHVSHTNLLTCALLPMSGAPDLRRIRTCSIFWLVGLPSSVLGRVAIATHSSCLSALARLLSSWYGDCHGVLILLALSIIPAIVVAMTCRRCRCEGCSSPRGHDNALRCRFRFYFCGWLFLSARRTLSSIPPCLFCPAHPWSLQLLMLPAFPLVSSRLRTARTLHRVPCPREVVVEALPASVFLAHGVFVVDVVRFLSQTAFRLWSSLMDGGGRGGVRTRRGITLGGHLRAPTPTLCLRVWI